MISEVMKTVDKRFGLWRATIVVLACVMVIAGIVTATGRVVFADGNYCLVESDEKEGFVRKDGEIFYYKDGRKVTGWVKDGGNMYYFYRSSKTGSGIPHTKGAMATGWQNIDGEKFYFYMHSSTASGKPHSRGAMATGWQTIDGCRYYFYKRDSTASGLPHTKGAMATGWQTLDGVRYYFYKSFMNSSKETHRKGAMATGWKTLDGKKYYFCESADLVHKVGQMATGGVNVKDKGYVFDKDGKVVITDMKGWYKVGNDYYFCDRTTGKMVIGDKANGIDLQKNGKAKMTDFAKEKIPVMIKAREVVAKITSPSDTKEQKMWKCWKYSIQYHYMYRDAPIRDHINDWACFDAHYANNILNAYGNLKKLGGECCAQSFCMGYLFTELNIGEVKLESTWKHGWVVVGGLVYDANYTKDRGKKDYWAVKRHPVADEKMFETVI